MISLYAAYTILKNKRLDKEIPRTLTKRRVVSNFQRTYFKKCFRNNKVYFVVLKISFHKNRRNEFMFIVKISIHIWQN